MTPCFSSICQTHVSLFFTRLEGETRCLVVSFSTSRRTPHFALFLFPLPFSPRGRNLGAFWLIESSPRASTSFPFAAEDKRMGEHRGMVINPRISSPSCAPFHPHPFPSLVLSPFPKLTTIFYFPSVTLTVVNI